MNLQEAKICNKYKYVVHINGNADSFGYWNPSKDTPFIISAIREYYNSELKTFSGAVELMQPDTATRYTVKLSNIFVDEETAKVLNDDINRLKSERLEKIIAQMITEGALKTDIVDCVKSVFEKVKVGAKKDKPQFDKDTKAKVYEIIDYLNEKSGAAFRGSSKATQKQINARLKEGYTVDDFKTVIDKKVNSWKDDSKMAAYIRPSTLFGTKFNEYLNEPVAEPKPKKDRLHSKPSFDINEIEKEAKSEEYLDWACKNI